MGRCYEFHAEIQPGCEQAMVVSAEGGACECQGCGARCTGRYSGCSVILAVPGRVPSSAPVWALPEPRATMAVRGVPVAAAGPAPVAGSGGRRRRTAKEGREASAAPAPDAAAPGPGPGPARAGRAQPPASRAASGGPAVIDLGEGDRSRQPARSGDTVTVSVGADRLGEVQDALVTAVARLAAEERAAVLDALAQLRAELVRRDMEQSATVARLVARDNALSGAVARLAQHQESLAAGMAHLAERHDQLTQEMDRFRPQMERIGGAMNRLAITLVQIEQHLNGGGGSLRKKLGR
ncbi:MAG TPA: hypothetical protein VFO65_05385 [Acidimicrobiales bacterium]|nr:hypothetical protein [Acidimicrobiales bacterium]